MVQLEDVASTVPRVRGLTLPAQYQLSVSVLQQAAEKQRFQLAVPQQTHQ